MDNNISKYSYVYIPVTHQSRKIVSVNIVEFKGGVGVFQSSALPTELPSHNIINFACY